MDRAAEFCTEPAVWAQGLPPRDENFRTGRIDALGCGFRDEAQRFRGLVAVSPLSGWAKEGVAPRLLTGRPLGAGATGLFKLHRGFLASAFFSRGSGS